MNPSSRLILSLAAASAAAIGSADAASLSNYDAVIAADNAGALPYAAASTSSVSVDGTNAGAFDFGATSGSVTMEFILSGDPVGGGRNGFIGVGSNATFSLRYEQWDDTGQLGFTHGGVADYTFTPAIASPTATTHVTYRWDAGTSTMDLYLNGGLAGTANAPGFLMPSGAGFLGNNAALSEGMVGTIDRVTVYDDAIDPATIAAHADAWLVPEATTPLLVAIAGFLLMFRRRRR